MITGAIKNQVDQIWNTFWSGGVSNPLSVIEKITYLLFAKRLDELHTAKEKQANLLGETLDNPIFEPQQSDLRWSRFKDFDPERKFIVFRDQVFSFIKSLNGRAGSAYTRFMKDAVFIIPTPALLDKVTNMLDAIPKQRQAVEKYAQKAIWQELDQDDAKVLAEQINGLPAIDADDEFARRFDLLILNLQLVLLQNNPSQANDQFKVREIAQGSEEKSAIPSVVALLTLIQELQTDAWWQDVTLPMLEGVRVKLRELIRFVDAEKKADVYTNFTDHLAKEDSAIYEVVKLDPNLQNYRNRVQRFIREHQDHVTIRRLKNNEPITLTDIAALETILLAQDGPIPKEEYPRIYGKEPLGKLVRSIVGLDRNAAKAVFAGFLAKSPALNSDQMAFLNEIVEYLVKNGVMEPKVIFAAPFNHHHELGVAGVFGDELSEQIIERIRLLIRMQGLLLPND